MTTPEIDAIAEALGAPKSTAAECVGRIAGLHFEISDLHHDLDKLESRLLTLARLIRGGHMAALREMAADLLDGTIEAGVKMRREAEGVRATGWVVEGLIETMVAHLDAMPASNFASMRASLPDGRRLTLTAQWEGARTPEDVLTERTAERDALRAEFAAAYGGKAGRLVATIEENARLRAERDELWREVENRRAQMAAHAGCGRETEGGDR